MRPLMKEASAAEASLTSVESFDMVSFCIRSSRTFADWAFSEGIVSDVKSLCSAKWEGCVLRLLLSCSRAAVGSVFSGVK